MPAMNSQTTGVAAAAVVAAAGVCQKVAAGLADRDALEKGDRSPVTVADFASQYVIATRLAESGLPLLAEEDADEFRAAPPELQQRVVQAVAVGEAEGDGPSFDEVVQVLDAGRDINSCERYWVLDPIDGTKGFLRHEQYAIALALIEQGKVVLGVLGCPRWDAGRLFGAEGGEAWTAPIEAPTQHQPIRVAGERPVQLVESVESGHSDHATSARIAEILGVTVPPMRMDSQAKYAAVACGEADVYLRLPTRADYQEKVWDHAAGLAVIEAAGGKVTDLDGKPLDFTHGRTLAQNRGIVATSNAGDLHDRVLAAVKEALDGR